MMHQDLFKDLPRMSHPGVPSPLPTKLAMAAGGEASGEDPRKLKEEVDHLRMQLQEAQQIAQGWASAYEAATKVRALPLHQER